MNQSITPVTKNIIIINVVMFVLSTYFFQNWQYTLSAYYPFSPNFHSWQVITHMFMHGGFMHLAFNMITLYSFGPILERVLGQNKFILLYFLCGLGSFLLFNLWNFYQVYDLSQTLIDQGVDIRQILMKSSIYYTGDPNISLPKEADVEVVRRLFSLYQSRMVGASGAIFGIVAGFSTLYPDAKMMFMFIPYPIKAKYLLPIIVVGSIFLGFRQFSWDNVAHFAHLGGALIGFLWLKQWKKNRDRIN